MDLRRLQQLAGIENGKHMLNETVPGFYDEEEENEYSNLPPAINLEKLRQAFVKAAQAVYNQWQQDETGYCDIQGHSGGICHTIADGIVEILYDAGYEYVTTFNSQIGENHVWTMVATADGVYEVDIPPSAYETGGGYTWKKIPDVTFEPSDIVISRISPDPSDIKNYLEDF